MHPWVIIKSNKSSNVVRFNLFTITKILFPLSLLLNAFLAHLLYDFYLPLFSHARLYSFTLLLCPFFNKEIDTVPSYFSLQPISDGDHLDKCDSPRKPTTKPLSSLLYADMNWAQKSLCVNMFIEKECMTCLP